MAEETRPGFLANYEIVRPGPPRLGPARRNLKTRPGPGPARPGPARIRPSPVDTSSTIDYIVLVPPPTHWVTLRPCGTVYNTRIVVSNCNM